ncbi:MAG: hypothetical protein S4CHLAM20_15590 [Chlamydiia bacterium]|nr:hypothetical protein [Chlamydiia bacterium]
MTYEISASLLIEIKKTGKVVFADFITETQIQILSHHADERDSFQICPLTKKILANRALGKLIYEIIEEKPIKLVMSKKVHKGEVFSIKDISIETVYIGVFFPFDGSGTMFFMPDHLPDFETDGLVALYGDARARYMQKEHDPDMGYLITKGYAGGDKLKSSEYPLIYK